MRASIVLVLALAAGRAAAEEGGGLLQSLRNGFNTAGAAISSVYTTYETAPYTVTNTVLAADNTTVLYEQRTYPTQNWVCTSDEDEEGRRDSFMRLFAYITGANEGGQNIPMTTPVSMMRVSVSEADLASEGDEQTEADLASEGDEQTEYSDEKSEQDQTELTMCFYINSQNQENPPAPSSSDVFLEDRPTITVLANRDGGFMSENDWEVLAEKLKTDSTANGETGVDYSKFYRAGYDSPMKFWNRRNEVWYVKQA